MEEAAELTNHLPLSFKTPEGAGIHRVSDGRRYSPRTPEVRMLPLTSQQFLARTSGITGPNRASPTRSWRPASSTGTTVM